MKRLWFEVVLEGTIASPSRGVIDEVSALSFEEPRLEVKFEIHEPVRLYEDPTMFLRLTYRATRESDGADEALIWAQNEHRWIVARWPAFVLRSARLERFDALNEMIEGGA